MILLTLLFLLPGWGGQQVYSQTVASVESKEEKRIVFTVEGLKSIEDARKTEALMVQQPGILRARTSYYTSLCGVITMTGSNIDEKYIVGLFESVGFKTRDYSEQLIDMAPKPEKTKQGPTLQESGKACSTVKSPQTSKIESKRRDLSSEEKIRQYEKIREQAIERGLSTKKYDEAIKKLKDEL